jgi:TM2 domain-containing membrane protein YozV
MARTVQTETVKNWNPGIAAVLSFIIPGRGQLYKQQLASGFAWFLFVLFGYFMFFVPGLFLHLFCIIAAASGNPYEKVIKG